MKAGTGGRVSQTTAVCPLKEITDPRSAQARMMETEKMIDLKRGDMVRDCYGKIAEVMEQVGTTVYLYDGTRAHRTKVFRVDGSE